MPRLYLHVGTHKTGTTSLQAYLLDHQAALERQGIRLITETHRKFGTVSNCLGFAHSILRDGLRSVARMTGDMPKASSVQAYFHRKQVRRQLRRLPEDTSAILSAEALCFARTGEEAERLRKVLSGLNLEIIVVLCFRKEADWRESWTSELQDWARHMNRDFGNGTDDIRGDWYFDRDAIVAFWQPFGDVRCVDFDASVAGDGSILPQLLAALDTPVIGGLEKYVLRKRS